MQLELNLDDPQFLAGIVIAQGVALATSPPELASRMDAMAAKRAAEEFPPQSVKDAIRQMLRRDGFRPSGRNKPASEYLAQAAREGRFPRINNLVDINNVLSLQSGLPISLLNADAVGAQAELRYGLEGERYVFNTGGQEIDLAGLVCVCRVDGSLSTPLGNPVKDSMAGKVKEQTVNVLGVIYASSDVIDTGGMSALLEEFARMLRTFAGATQVETRLLTRADRQG